MVDFTDINPRSRLLHLKEELYKWVEAKDEVVIELNSLADNLDGHFNRISKAKIGGSTAGIVGGILATVGFGLSFVTFGTSLGLVIAGGVIAGAGGAAVSGSVITDAVLSKHRRKSAEDILEKYQSRVEDLKKECVKIGVVLNQQHGNMEESFPSWIRFWAKVVIGTAVGAKNIGWDVIARTVLNSLRIASYADDAILVGASAGLTAFKTIGSTAGRGLHIAGGVFGILMLPLDMYTLVDSAIDVHKSKPHKVSEEIRKKAAKMTDECPSKIEIDIMIKETLADLDK